LTGITGQREGVWGTGLPFPFYGCESLLASGMGFVYNMGRSGNSHQKPLPHYRLFFVFSVQYAVFFHIFYGFPILWLTSWAGFCKMNVSAYNLREQQ
jgi:hypothetical protein